MSSSQALVSTCPPAAALKLESRSLPDTNSLTSFYAETVAAAAAAGYRLRPDAPGRLHSGRGHGGLIHGARLYPLPVPYRYE
jgi:hypothetical protein